MSKAIEKEVKAMKAFIKVCKYKQLMQTLDIPAGTFPTGVLQCQLCES